MLYSHNGIEDVIFSKINHRKVGLFEISQLNKIEKDMNVVIVGLPDEYKDEVNITLDNVRFIDNNLDFDPESLDNSCLILIGNINHNYALSYKIECLANKKRIPLGKLVFDKDNKSIDHLSEAAMYEITL